MVSHLASALASSFERVILKLFFERFYKETTSLKEVRGLRSGLHHRWKCNLCEKEVDQFEAYTKFRTHVAFFSKTLVPVSVFHRKESPLRWNAVKIDIVKVFCFWFMVWGFMAYGDGLEFTVWAFMGQDLELWFMECLWGKRLWGSTAVAVRFVALLRVAP